MAKKRTDKEHYQKRHPWVVHLYCARQRCENPKVESYPNYGGRGIQMNLSPESIRVLWFDTRGRRLDTHQNFMLD